MPSKQNILDDMVSDFLDAVFEFFPHRKFGARISESKQETFILVSKKKELFVSISDSNYLKFWMNMLKQFLNSIAQNFHMFIEIIILILNLFLMIIRDISILSFSGLIVFRKNLIL